MSFALGFLKGFADTAKSGIEARQAEEAERRKLELLEQLRRDTIKYQFELGEESDKKKVSDKLSSVDMTTRERIFRNANGEEIRRVPLTETELKSMELDMRKGELDIANTESMIADRSLDNARSDRLTAAQIDSYNRSGRDDSTTGDKGNKILFKEAEAAFSNLHDIVHPAVIADFKAKFMEGINSKGWSPSQQRIFLQEMQRRALRKNAADNKGRPLRETHEAVTRIPLG